MNIEDIRALHDEGSGLYHDEVTVLLEALDAAPTPTEMEIIHMSLRRAIKRSQDRFLTIHKLKQELEVEKARNDLAYNALVSMVARLWGSTGPDPVERAMNDGMEAMNRLNQEIAISCDRRERQAMELQTANEAAAIMRRALEHIAASPHFRLGTIAQEALDAEKKRRFRA